ncbi:MAG TPA: type IV toxin-antitoxin system AbiEi family antitoxin domain-containing protein [Solirubrobacterales bacterium]|nr:type IV toxin-antitoxin system AbiEi family antitoxin domain-containing protein [Solirubrobacterales bacterium]
MAGQARQRGRELAALAGRQHGVVSIRQLRHLGFGRNTASYANSVGRLHRIHRGVYAVGHPALSLHGRCFAAVLACGPEALLSHYSAAWLWGLSPTVPIPVHVTAPMSRSPRLPVRLHRASKLAATDRAVAEGIPVTSVARVMLDQAALIDERRLRRLLKRAEELDLFDLAAIHDVLERNRGHHGRRRLRRALLLYEAPAFTRSDFEARFYEAVIAAGLPRPRVNFNLAGMEVDLYWPEHRLAVELDLFETHGTREAFEEDRLRRERLMLEGIEVNNVTGPRFQREPKEVLERLRRLIARRGGAV